MEVIILTLVIIGIITAVLIQIRTAHLVRPEVFNIQKSLYSDEKMLFSRSYLKIGSNNIYTEDGWFFITSKRLLVRSKNSNDSLDCSLAEINAVLNNSEKLFAYTKKISFTGWENQPYITLVTPNLSLPIKLRGWDYKYFLNNEFKGFAGDHTYLGLYLMLQKLKKGNTDIENELDIINNKKQIVDNIELAQMTFHNLLICGEQASAKNL